MVRVTIEKMTQEEIDEVWEGAVSTVDWNPTIRLGQAFFNELYIKYPAIANKIRATEYDPFYNNKVLDKCKNYLLTI